MVFLVAMVAEVERVPFDLPEAEAELVEGWGTEYGGMRFGLIMMSEYARGFVGLGARRPVVPGRLGRADLRHHPRGPVVPR